MTKTLTQIPQPVLDSGWNKKVHVHGWNPATCFHYVSTDASGLHTIKTDKGKEYRTKQPLCYTKRYEPKASAISIHTGKSDHHKNLYLGSESSIGVETFKPWNYEC